MVGLLTEIILFIVLIAVMFYFIEETDSPLIRVSIVITIIIVWGEYTF